jgi:spore coat polysaccharide biosynthesis protein SpsF (cytidylyltransferase family)
MKVGILIQARSDSTRLPGKVFEMIGDKSMLEHVYYACDKVKLKDHEITTEVIGCEKDTKLRQFCKEKNLKYWYKTMARHDLLQRYYKCARDRGYEAIVRITSDCPFIQPSYIAEAIELLETHDYVSNTQGCFLDGQDIQACRFDLLRKYRMMVRSEEHLFQRLESSMLKNPKFDCKIAFLINREKTIPNPKHPENKLSVDTQADLDRVRKLYELVAKKQ